MRNGDGTRLGALQAHGCSWLPLGPLMHDNGSNVSKIAVVLPNSFPIARVARQIVSMYSTTNCPTIADLIHAREPDLDHLEVPDSTRGWRYRSVV